MSDDAALPPSDRIGVEPTRAQLEALAEVADGEPIVMLNLLRFRAVADYAGHDDLAPDAPISGEAAYRRYGEAATPHIEGAGASIVYAGACGPTVIGPPDESWDQIILVRYPAKQAFFDMVTTPEYVALSGHRTAALADSRLVQTAAW